MWKEVVILFLITVITSVYGDTRNVDTEYELIDGDIIIPKRSHLRAAIKLDLGQWFYRKSDGKYVIPYVIEAYYSASMLHLIRFVMAFYEKHTNLKFESKTSAHSDWVRFVDDADCSSAVGRDRNAVPQVISLHKNCEYIDTVFHEIGHTIGLDHMHQRSDRDKYVSTRGEHNYALKDPNYLDSGQILPYDFASVMHYRTDPNVIPHPAFFAEIKNLTFILNNREMPSTCDMRAINIMHPGNIKPGPCIPHQRESLCRPTEQCFDSHTEEECEEHCKFFKPCTQIIGEGDENPIICYYLTKNILEAMDPLPQYAYTGGRALPL